MITRLKDKLALKGPVHMCWSVLRDPQLLRAIALQDFDVLLLDGQHGFHTETSLLEGISQVAGLGKSPVVRIPVGRWDMAERMLDFGALGVVAPMINNRSDAEAFAKACKYPQVGQRSFGPAYASSLYHSKPDEYLNVANTSTYAIAQIETREAYENLDDIINVDGIDGVLMGPGDFSISMTGNIIPDPYGPDTVDAVRKIAGRVNAKGKLAAAFTDRPEHSRLVEGMGYKLISVMIDQAIAELGAQVALERIGR